MKQLELWEQEALVFECVQSWADGDTSLPALQRLAAILPGKLQVSDWKVRPAFFYCVVGTRIEGDKVIAACRVVPSPLGTALPTNDDEEE